MSDDTDPKPATDGGTPETPETPPEPPSGDQDARGRFTKGNRANPKFKQRARPEKARGLAAKARAHEGAIIAGLLKEARESTSATARVRAWAELRAIGWGAPSPSRELGGDAPKQGGNPSGASEGLLSKLERMAAGGIGIDPPGLDTLTPEEQRQYRDLRDRAAAAAGQPVIVSLPRPTDQEQPHLPAAYEPAQRALPAPVAVVELVDDGDQDDRRRGGDDAFEHCMNAMLLGRWLRR